MLSWDDLASSEMNWDEVEWGIEFLAASFDFVSGVVVEPAVFGEISINSGCIFWV